MATMGQPQPPVKKSNTGRRILIIVVILALACIVCGVVGLVVVGPAISGVANSLVASTAVATDFMTAIKNNDYTKAYSLVIPEQQQAFGGSADGMKQLFMDNKWDQISAFEFKNISTENNDGIATYDVTFGGDTKKTMEVHLRKSGDTWKILGFRTKSA